jgi:hypothetical protein
MGKKRGRGTRRRVTRLHGYTITLWEWVVSYRSFHIYGMTFYNDMATFEK